MQQQQQYLRLLISTPALRVVRDVLLLLGRVVHVFSVFASISCLACRFSLLGFFERFSSASTSRDCSLTFSAVILVTPEQLLADWLAA